MDLFTAFRPSTRPSKKTKKELIVQGEQAITDWTSLPRDVLGYILEKFQTLDEYLLFGRVCTEWRAVVKDQKGWQELSNARMPLLMIPSSEDPSNIRKLYNVVDNKPCKIWISLPYKGRCCGSSHGWVATFGPDMVITLWNLFSGRCIHLPRIFSSPPHGVSRIPFLDHSGWISKVVLSGDPDDSAPEKCVVGVVYEKLGQLAFMRLSDEGWTYVEPWLTFMVYDIFFRDGYLYAIDDLGKLIRIDTSISSFVTKEEAEVIVPFSFQERASRPYIAESCRGDILMIRRFVDAIPPYRLGMYFTMTFDIFKLVTSEEEGSRWVEMKSLNDEIIFLGDSQTTSFLCSNFPGSKPNRIYYTDDCFEGGGYDMQGPTDLGVFNIEEGTLEATYTVNDSELRLPPAVFLVPKLDDKLFLIQQ